MSRAARRMAMLSSVALGASALLLALSLWSALHVRQPVVGVVPTRQLATAFGAVALPDAVDTSANRVALASDPFDPDRAVPGENVADASAADDPPAQRDSTGTVRLLGTVVRGNGGFAVCQIASEAPRIVHIGERIGALTLTTLTQGHVAFRAANGSRVELSLSKPET